MDMIIGIYSHFGYNWPLDIQAAIEPLEGYNLLSLAMLIGVFGRATR